MSWLWHVLMIAVIQKQKVLLAFSNIFAPCLDTLHDMVRIYRTCWSIILIFIYDDKYFIRNFSFVNNHLSLVTSIIYQLIFESLQDHKRRPNRCLPCKSSGSFRFRRKYFLACRIIPQTCGIDQVIFSHFRFNKIRICIKNAILFVMEENMLK